MKLDISADTIQSAVSSKVITPAAGAWAIDNLPYLNKPMTLLSSSYKTKKSDKYGYMTAILYMQPSDVVAVKTLCAAAVLAGCKKGCLISSGQLGMPTGQNAATKRTILFLLDPVGFDACILQEVDKLSLKHGERLAVRYNGTTDIDISHLAKARPLVTWYDYTKIYARVIKNTLPNYHLTYSGSAYSKKTMAMTARAINAGVNVALAFNTKETKDEWTAPEELTSFDDSDMRFLDQKGSIGKLTRKGSSKLQRSVESNTDSFFFTPKTYAQLIPMINLG